VIQPEGVKTLAASSWSLTNTILNEQCFRYEYDERSRMKMKKVPGAGQIWMVYDKRDRLVLIQDANLRQSNKWLFTKYDEFDRPIVTGFYTNSTYTTQSGMQGYLYTQNLAYSETYNPANYPIYSLNQSFPVVNFSDVLTVTYYDNYTWSGWYGNYGTKDNSYDSYGLTPSNSYPYAQPLTQSNATKGLVTGVWQSANSGLLTAMYYDDKGRVIQTKSFNHTAGVDIATTQYSWSGQPLINVLKTEITGSNAQTTIVVTQNTYDDLGRLTKTEKKLSNSLVNGNAMSTYKTIAENEYDNLGQLKKKKLAPAYNSNAGLESLNYDYNIRGWMLGMNRDYAKDANNNNWFGFDLGYDKANNNIIGNQTYANPQLNGNIEGMVWKSKGDGEKRKYDFYYDAANRLLKADFTQYTGGVFNLSAGVDFSMKMGDGTNVATAYDANGNILQMQQWGLKLTSSSQIDNLSYLYQTGSNKLARITDANNDPNTKLGDFKDGTNTGTDDYNYDLNGNLTLDNNKAISSITYNYLNLPSVITVTGKGTITYTYDAGGTKLKKVTYDNSVAGKTISTTTNYIAGAVYQSKITSPSDPGDYTDRLQFIGHEEGRIRFKPVDGAIPANFQYDYFLKDHLGNVRMVLTEEQQQDVYPAATLENTSYNGNTAIYKEADYYSIDNSKVVNQSVATSIPVYQNNNGNPPYNNNPYSNTTANSARLYQLNATNNTNADKNGLGIVLKVMAGDNINIFGKSYHKRPSGSGYTSTTNGIIVSELINAFAGTSIISSKGITGANITGQVGFPSTMNGLIGTQPAQSGGQPKAAINWIILDEQFKWVAGGFDMVGDAGTNTSGTFKSHSILGIPISKNGYIYVYVSNESKYNVFFDNLQLIQNRGPILEETHYYPFGLTMNGISSKALSFGNPENKKRFNGGTELANKEFGDGSGLELYETTFRQYDPQIGRFSQIDWLSPEYSEVSPYCFGSNNPVLRVDPTGLKDTIVNGEHALANVTLETVVVKAAPKLKGGQFNGQSYSSIATYNKYGLGSNSIRTKIAFTNDEARKRLEEGQISMEEFAKSQRKLGEAMGGVTLYSLVHISELVKKIKDGEMPVIVLFAIAGSAMIAESEKSEDQAKQLGGIAKAYSDLHSTTTTPNPAPAKGIYIISYFSVTASTGGAGAYTSTSYYDIATKKFLGEIHANY